LLLYLAIRWFARGSAATVTADGLTT